MRHVFFHRHKTPDRVLKSLTRRGPIRWPSALGRRLAMENLEDRNLLSVMADVPVAAQHTLSSGPITIDPIVQGAKLNNSAGPKYDTQTTVVSVSPTGPVFGELMKFEAKINCSGSSSALSGNITFKDTVNGEITSTITTAVNGPPGVIVFVYDRWLPSGQQFDYSPIQRRRHTQPKPP